MGSENGAAASPDSYPPCFIQIALKTTNHIDGIHIDCLNAFDKVNEGLILKHLVDVPKYIIINIYLPFWCVVPHQSNK